MNNIDTNAIDAYYEAGLLPVDEATVGLDLNEDGDMTDLGVNTLVFVIRQNGAGLDLVESIINY